MGITGDKGPGSSSFIRTGGLRRKWRCASSGASLTLLHTAILLLVCFALPVLAEEPRVYTEEDLDKYATHSTYDQETISRSNTEMKKWEEEKAREEQFLKTQDEAERREEVRKRIGTVTSNEKSASQAKKKKT